MFFFPHTQLNAVLPSNGIGVAVGGVPPQHEGQIGDRLTELERPGAWSWGGEEDTFMNVWLVISLNLRGCSKSVELDSIMGLGLIQTQRIVFPFEHTSRRQSR